MKAKALPVTAPLGATMLKWVAAAADTAMVWLVGATALKVVSMTVTT